MAYMTGSVEGDKAVFRSLVDFYTNLNTDKLQISACPKCGEKRVREIHGGVTVLNCGTRMYKNGGEPWIHARI